VTRPSAAVVVVNWNGGAVLGPCLRSLSGQGLPVVVVDNASDDGSPDLVGALLPEATLVRRPANDGFAAGVNAGVAVSDADVVLLLNNDAIAAPGWADAMLEPFGRPGAEDLAAVTGHVVLDGWFAAVPAGEPAPAGTLRDAAGTAWRRTAEHDAPAPPGSSRRTNSTGNELTLSANGRDRDWLAPADGPPAPVDVFGLNGGSAAIRRSALAAVGGLDESLFMYYEDTDLSWRLRLAGWRVAHAPGARTVHRHAASSGTGTEFFRFHNARNRLVVADRHAPASVAARAWLRTLGGVVRGPDRGVRARAALAAAARLPADLRTRRRVGSRPARRRVAAALVPD
jgi:N-acetylglucosaminyl-diphospho-decaprenol L-rhamnosyltransferase